MYNKVTECRNKLVKIRGAAIVGYYSTTNLGDGIYSIFEMIGVGAYLIVGDEKALLIDTGYGFGNLRKEVEKITQKPLIVVNSHLHADHCLGNSQFEEAYAAAADLPKLQGDYLHKQYDTLIGYGAKMFPALRLLLLYAKLKRKPHYDTQYKTLAENMSFDLGGRVIRFVSLPGHTEGSVVALDEQTQTVFAGDAINGGLFLFFDPAVQLAEYAGLLRAFAKTEGYGRLLLSHQKEPLPFSFTGWCADFLERASLEKSEVTDFPNEGRTVYQYTENSEECGACSVFFTAENVSAK